MARADRKEVGTRFRLFSNGLLVAMLLPMNTSVNSTLLGSLEKSLTLSLEGPEATLTLGARLGDLLVRHHVSALLLFGRLGCGKTTLVRGLISDLPGGHRAEVSSPSFTLCNLYPTKPAVAHCDLYRSDIPLPLPEEAEDVLESNGLVIVEWAERLPSAERPVNRLDIRLIPCQEGRLATLYPHGDAARCLVTELASERA